MDVLAKGSVEGSAISVGIECKRYTKKLGIGKVGEFAGKLDDIGAQSGILYALSGLSPGAQARADGAGPIRIEIRDLTADLADWSDDLHELVGRDCENENCFAGTVIWREWPQESGELLRAGSCDSCGTWAVHCGECGEDTAFIWRTQQCDGCERVYEQLWDRKDSDVDDVRVVSLSEA